MKIRNIEDKDIEIVGSLITSMIDDIYAKEPQNVRDALKNNFTGKSLKELASEKHTLFYVVEDNNKVIAFVFGWLFQEIFTIYWIYNSPEYRGKGVAKDLMKHLETELRGLGCYKIDMYMYAGTDRFIQISEKLGFQKGALIEKSMFGVKIQNVYKYLTDKKVEEKKIKIVGEAGQGIKLLSYTLGTILASLGNEVSLNLEYDSAVRSGTIIADLIFSEKKIENPIIEEADVLIKFARTRKWFPAKQLVLDDNICGKKCIDCSMKCNKSIRYNFTEKAQSEFGSKMFINMVALGRILRYMGINIMLINIKDILPPKFVDKNIEAIKYGFSFKT